MFSIRTKFLRRCMLLLVCGIHCIAYGSEIRIWTSSSGKHKIQAQFMMLEGEKVLLHKKDGTTIRVSVNKLSRSDQDFVKAQRFDNKNGINLLSARAGHKTRLTPRQKSSGTPAPNPPSGVFERIKYESPSGKLTAYISPDPKDGQKHPAILWAHGGFDGIGDGFWENPNPQNDQSAHAFRNAGIILMVPSWRAENDNPGEFEMFYGEVNDLLAARDHLARLPYVNPNRIYVAGHSTGGTLALLSVTATNKFRAAFSFGGAPNIQRLVADGKGYGNTPFDYRNEKEGTLRSAIFFTEAIDTPTFYFEGDSSGYCEDALEMEIRAKNKNVPFTACIIEGGNHFDILAPLTAYVAQQIANDTEKQCTISITSKTANDVYQKSTQRRRERRRKALASIPPIELTASAVAKIKKIMSGQSLELESTYFEVNRTSKGWQIGFTGSFDADTHKRFQQDGIAIIIPKDSLARVHGHLIGYVNNGGQKGFRFDDRYSE